MASGPIDRARRGTPRSRACRRARCQAASATGFAATRQGCWPIRISATTDRIEAIRTATTGPTRTSSEMPLVTIGKQPEQDPGDEPVEDAAPPAAAGARRERHEDDADRRQRRCPRWRGPMAGPRSGTRTPREAPRSSSPRPARRRSSARCSARDRGGPGPTRPSAPPIAASTRSQGRIAGSGVSRSNGIPTVRLATWLVSSTPRTGALRLNSPPPKSPTPQPEGREHAEDDDEQRRREEGFGGGHPHIIAAAHAPRPDGLPVAVLPLNARHRRGGAGARDCARSPWPR